MPADVYTIDPVIELLRRQTIASLPEIMHALGTPSHRTACRKIAAANCRSSYSHRGRFYTLDDLASYDANGLWSYRDVRFSSAGSLMATLETLVSQAADGLYCSELTRLLGVDTQDALRKLVKAERLWRVRVEGRFLYCSFDPERRRVQLRARQATRPDDDVKRRRAAFVSEAAARLAGALDERQRRLFAGLESLRHGHGGDRRVAAELGMSAATVGKGRKELLAGDLDVRRVRKPGGGRKPIEKKTPPSPI